MAESAGGAMTGRSELVATAEIARRAGISPKRVRELYDKPGFPPAIGQLGNWPVRRWAPVRDWLIKTGRLTK